MDSQFDQGLATRKQVMGEDFVAKAMGQATEFTRPMQQYITRNAWGDVWQREGLDLLHASIYCGVPAAVEAFRAAAEVVDGPGQS